ncbi:Trm112 family protein [candidate division GN15 bacterium]|nr:Trm112 family protein [candidate division GN15 bacterium]
MALPQTLVNKLCCPICSADLEYKAADERLKCTSCHAQYKVVDDVPVLQADEAETVDK